jgi:hypothetical protein
VFVHRDGPLALQARKRYYIVMKKAIPKAWGGRRAGAGRKPTGRDPVTAIRLSPEFIAQVEAWATKQPDKPGRSEAIRRLVELGLKAKAK